jgi:hypothetical protein
MLGESVEWLRAEFFLLPLLLVARLKPVAGEH